MAKKVTAPAIRAMKGSGQQVVSLTAYDYTSGLLADQSGVEIVLVGDSLGTVIQGQTSTVPVTLSEVVYHVRAARRGVERALFVADMPFGSYGSSVSQAVDSAVQLVRNGAEAVKLEGTYTEEVKAIVRTGVPVMGHIGMTPQSIHAIGGHRVQGRGDAASRLIDQAKALEDAGVFSIVLELTTSETSERVTKAVGVPTIGIGAGPHCDGQIQVFHDLLGLYPVQFKHSKRYANGRTVFLRALRRYANDVREGKFPEKEQSF